MVIVQLICVKYRAYCSLLAGSTKTCVVLGQGPKLLGFQVSETPKNSAGNPKFGTGLRWSLLQRTLVNTAMVYKTYHKFRHFLLELNANVTYPLYCYAGWTRLHHFLSNCGCRQTSADQTFYTSCRHAHILKSGAHKFEALSSIAWHLYSMVLHRGPCHTQLRPNLNLV